MSKLRESLKQYFELRRNLGSKLRGVDSALRNFVAFAERENASYITTDLALRWAQGTAPCTAGNLGFASSDGATVLPSGSARQIDVPKYRPLVCFPTVITESRLISIAMRRSKSLSGRHANSLPQGTEGPHLLDDLWTSVGHRYARQRSVGPRSRGRQPGGRDPQDSADEIRQVSAGPGARVDPSSPRRLRTSRGTELFAGPRLRPSFCRNVAPV